MTTPPVYARDMVAQQVRFHRRLSTRLTNQCQLRLVDQPQTLVYSKTLKQVKKLQCKRVTPLHYASQVKP